MPPPSKRPSSSSRPKPAAKSSKHASNPPKSKDAPPPAASTSKPNSKKRKSSALEDDAPDGKAPLLVARTRTIPSATVSAKWSPLNEPSQASIATLLSTAQRPVLMTFTREARRAEAQAVTNRLVAKLGGLLEKVPVPALGVRLGGTGKEERGLTMEALMDRNRALEEELVPAARSVREMEEELAAQKRALEEEEEALRRLERNARNQERVGKEKERAAPKLLRLPQGEVRDGKRDIALKEESAENRLHREYKPENDRDILPLTKQLQQHFHSMQVNAGAVTEVNEWMSRSRGAVEEVLLGVGVLDTVEGV